MALVGDAEHIARLEDIDREVTNVFQRKSSINGRQSRQRINQSMHQE